MVKVYLISFYVMGWNNVVDINMVCCVLCAEALDVIKESDAGGNSGGAPEASVVESAMRFCPQFRWREK